MVCWFHFCTCCCAGPSFHTKRPSTAEARSQIHISLFLPDSLATAVGSFQYVPRTQQFVEPVERSGRPQDNATCSLAAGAEYMSVANMRQTLVSLYLGGSTSVNYKHTLPLFMPYLRSWTSGHK